MSIKQLHECVDAQMVRTYKRKSERASYGSEALGSALDAVQAGTAVRATSRMYGVPAKTIRRHRDMKVSAPGITTLGSKRTVFKPEYESLLVQHIQDMSKALFGLTTVDVRRLAYDLAEHLKIDHPFKSPSAGIDWLKGFLRRHSSLSIRAPEATSISRAVGFNRPQVSAFFHVLKDALDKSHVDALKIWNMDETGLSNVHKPVNIVAIKGARSVGKITSGERGVTVTVLCAMNAAGTFVPPTFVYPRKRMVQSLMNGAPAGALGLCTASGWTDSSIFMRWLQHFTTFIKCSPEDPHILVLDGHHSHKTLEACLFAREKGVIIVTFPPHCTHRLQPLDVCFFKSLKSAYNLESGNWMTSNPGRRISVFEVASIFANAYNKCAAVQKAVTGFQVCGIWPYNPDQFNDDDFTASYLTEEPISQSQATPSADPAVATDTSTTDPAATTSPNFDAVPTDPAVATDTSTTDPAATTSPNFDAVPTDPAVATDTSTTDPAATTSPNFDAVPTDPASTTDPATDIATTSAMSVSTPVMPPSSVRFKAALAELSPRPHIAVQRTRKRKTESAVNVTSSPYKQLLTEKAVKTTAKPRKVPAKGKAKCGLNKPADKCAKSVQKKVKATARHSSVPTTAKLNKAERCRGCDILEGSKEDVELQQGWIACEGCGKWFHDVCRGKWFA